MRSGFSGTSGAGPSASRRPGAHAERRRRGGAVGGGDEQRGAGVGEDVLELGVGVGGVHRDDDQPGAQRAERPRAASPGRSAAGRRPGRRRPDPSAANPAAARSTAASSSAQLSRWSPATTAGASGRRRAAARTSAASDVPASLTGLLLRWSCVPATGHRRARCRVHSGRLAWTGWGDVVTMGPDPQHARPSPGGRAGGGRSRFGGPTRRSIARMPHPLDAERHGCGQALPRGRVLGRRPSRAPAVRR